MNKATTFFILCFSIFLSHVGLAKGILLNYPSEYEDINDVYQLIRYGKHYESYAEIQASLQNPAVQNTPKLHIEFQILNLFWHYYHEKAATVVDSIASTIKYAQRHNLKEILPTIYFLKGHIHTQVKNSNEMVQAYEAAVEWANKIGDKAKVTVYQAYVNDAIEVFRYRSTQVFLDANVLPKMEAAMDLLLTEQDTLGFIDLFPRHADIIRTDGNWDEFRIILKDWEYLVKHQKNIKFEISYHSKRAAYFLEEGDKDSAIFHLNQALLLSKEIDIKLSIEHYYFRLCNIYRQKKQFQKALACIDSIKTLGNRLEMEVFIHKNYARIYEAMDKPRIALKHSKILRSKHLKLLQEHQVQDLAEWETKFNLQEKENLIIQQQARNQALWWIIAIAILSILTIAYAFLAQLKAKRAILRQKNIIANQAKELTELDALKSRFFANITHELRTPLTLMLSPIKSLLKEEKLSERGETLLQISHRNGKNLQKLINEILALTKLENKEIALIEKPSLLFLLINKIISNFESHARINNIDLLLEYQAHPEIKILLDQNKIETILNNLIANALKFTPNKGKIKVLVRNAENHISIQVIDNGQGIHSEDMPHIFERFFQSKNKEIATASGLGIGLALSKELAKAMKGDLTVQSKLGKGSCFKLTFPFKRIFGELEDQEVRMLNKWQTQAQVLPENHIVTSQNEVPLKTVSKSFKILLVEDNVDLRQYLQSMLSSFSEVKIAPNGQMAWDLLSQSCEKSKAIKEKVYFPDLILSDLMMPLMNGYELLKKVKSDNRLSSIPFLMLTARGGLDDKLTALRIGVDDYLTKPFDNDELLLRVQNLLKNVKNRMSPNENVHSEVIEETLTILPTDQEWLKELEKIIQAHLNHSNFNVDYLANLLPISKRGFQYKLKKLTGTTPAQYIQEIRLATARQLLEKNPNLSIKEITYHIGLKDAAYFSKLFKKRFGKLPSQYIVHQPVISNNS